MLTVPQAARRVGKNPETVRRWIREGKLRATKVGTQHVIDEDDVADAMRGVFARPSPGSDPGRAPDALTIGSALREGRSERAHQVREVAAAYAVAPERHVLVVDPWLSRIVGRIVRAVDPLRIVLFGSRARGDSRADSDYDLLVIVTDAPNRRAMEVEIRRSFRDVLVSADVVVATDREAQGRVPGRPAGVVYWALKEGLVVYDRGDGS